MTLVLAGDTWEEAYDHASLDLMKIKNWFDHNVVSVNVDKTKHLPIFMKNDPGPRTHFCGDHHVIACGCGTIERVEQYKYSPIFLTVDSSWESCGRRGVRCGRIVKGFLQTYAQGHALVTSGIDANRRSDLSSTVSNFREKLHSQAREIIWRVSVFMLNETIEPNLIPLKKGIERTVAACRVSVGVVKKIRKEKKDLDTTDDTTCSFATPKRKKRSKIVTDIDDFDKCVHFLR
ncbi:hypothetical protein J6590_001417 [Homalodisca vitripennis]|nr:hypothetical protein J6590_001417 [Homalodisca vitripennis]